MATLGTIHYISVLEHTSRSFKLPCKVRENFLTSTKFHQFYNILSGMITHFVPAVESLDSKNQLLSSTCIKKPHFLDNKMSDIPDKSSIFNRFQFRCRRSQSVAELTNQSVAELTNQSVADLTSVADAVPAL